MKQEHTAASVDDTSNGMPLVSICIPTYNSSATVLRALSSAVAQNSAYPNIEIVLVDDASSDDTVDKVRRYNSPVVSVIQQPSNVGLIANHNSCLQHANGSLIKFLHADDELVPGAVAELVKTYLAYPASLVVAPRKVITQESSWRDEYGDVTASLQTLGPCPSPSLVVQKFLTQRTLRNFFGEPSSVLISTDAARSLGGFSSSYPQLLDLDLWLRLTLSGGVSVQDSVSAVRHHTASTATASNRRNINSRYDMARVLGQLASDERLSRHIRFIAATRRSSMLARSGLRAAVRRDSADLRAFLSHLTGRGR